MENIDYKDIVKIQHHSERSTSEVEESVIMKQQLKNTQINIGIVKEISKEQLAETIKTAVGFKGEFYFNTNKPDGSLGKLTDSSKLENLGWKYSIELEEGIKSMYAWYLKKYFV